MEQQVGGFFGRQVELGVLDEAFGRAVQTSVPQTISVVGVAGIGKSRLIDAWIERQGTGARIVRAAVGLVAVDGAAAPPPRGALISRLLRERCGLAALGSDEALLQFRAVLQEVFADRRISELAAILGRFVGFDLPDSPLGSALLARPEQGAELAHTVLARFFEQDAAGRPLVIVAEDLQDADDESLDEMARLSAELTGAPILIIATARPDLIVRRPGWGHQGGAQARLDLVPLALPEIAALVHADLGVTVPVAGLTERIAAESAGNPRAAHQALSVYLAEGILTGSADDGWRFDRERAARPRPIASREEVAPPRITRLSAAERDVLARAAVFGDLFWTGGVVALGRLDAAPPDEAAVFAPDPTITEIQRILDGLQARGLVERRPSSSIPEETAWSFGDGGDRRSLASDGGAELVRRRKAFAAEWLASRGGEGHEHRLEALARLYEEAGDARRAATCFVTAAGLARDHFLLDRAHALYLAGIRLLDLDDAGAKMDALYAAGDVAARRGQTREAVGLFQEMLLLAWRLDLPAKGGAAHGRIGRLCSTLGENARARAHLELAQKLFEVAGDWPGVAAALDDVGRILFLMGDPERSLERHRAALGVREQLGDDRGRALTLSRLGQVLRATGALAGAGEHFRAALDLRRRIGDLPGVISSLLDLGALERDLGNRAKALALLTEGRDLARAGGERLQECSLSIEIGDTQLADGQPHTALGEFEAAREIARQFGARGLLSEATRGLAETELALGEAARARDSARSAFEMAERAGAPPLAGAALRVAASAVGAGAPGESDLGGAREMFDRAVEVLTAARAELELARTLDAYAEFEDRSGRDETAAELRRQARLIRRRGAAESRPTAP